MYTTFTTPNCCSLEDDKQWRPALIEYLLRKLDAIDPAVDKSRATVFVLLLTELHLAEASAYAADPDRRSRAIEQCKVFIARRDVAVRVVLLE